MLLDTDVAKVALRQRPELITFGRLGVGHPPQAIKSRREEFTHPA
jgi:hypothetical protein